jgi:hypothetical protein
MDLLPFRGRIAQGTRLRGVSLFEGEGLVNSTIFLLRKSQYLRLLPPKRWLSFLS